MDLRCSTAAADDSQAFGDRQLTKIYNVGQIRLPRQPAPPPLWSNIYPPPHMLQSMDHLSMAFDHAVHNLNQFLDTIGNPVSQQPVQVNLPGLSALIVDYHYLLEACCVNHPVLRSKLNIIGQKILFLQKNGQLVSNGPNTTSLALLGHNSTIMSFPSPFVAGGLPMMGQTMAGYFGQTAMNQPHMPRTFDSPQLTNFTDTPIPPPPPSVNSNANYGPSVFPPHRGHRAFSAEYLSATTPTGLSSPSPPLLNSHQTALPALTGGFLPDDRTYTIGSTNVTRYDDLGLQRESSS